MTADSPNKSHYLPSREVSYAYTVAMHFAQHFEQNLRAILYTADYHGWIRDIELSEDDKKRFQDSESFIDNATLGKLLVALKKTAWIKDKKLFSCFERACTHRNKLAHSYLAGHGFDHPSKKRDQAIISELHGFTYDLYGAVQISRAFRDRCEVEADKVQASMNELWQEMGWDPHDDPNRHFVSRKKTK